jgi:putative tryptophan/tyrosine transport system substrate-binding protein
MRRREFIALLGGAAASPLFRPTTARAQPSMPVIGFISSRAPGDAPELLAAFLQGLKGAGFVEGQNVTVEYRFAENQNERLPALAADLVQRQVTVIAAPTTPAALAAKVATATIPIVVATAGDPVGLGLVASLNRPGGNVTGVTLLFVEVAAKRLELLHELIPTASIVGLLVNPANPPIAEANAAAVLSAAHSLGLELHVLKASTERDFDGVFANLIQLRAGGLVIGGDPFFTGQQELLAALAARHAVPMVYENREFVAAGGLMSYGGNLPDAYRLAAVYAARILKGEKPADLPVQQSTKVELFLNLKTAKALGITVPLSLLGRADEVIE